MFRGLVSLVAALLCLGARADGLAQFHLPNGELVLELYDEDKPVTTSNFRKYVEDGRYRDTFVQRWEPGFVIQGGGWWVTNRGGPGPLIVPVTPDAAITNEYQVGRVFSNGFGTIAMARAPGQTNSAGSQWFINLADNAFLDQVDGGFTVFGRTLVGTNLLARFADTQGGQGIWQLNLGTSLPTLPVLTNNLPTLDDLMRSLVYTDIGLPAWPRIQLQVQADGVRTLSWNSLSNLVNQVEFASHPGGPWQTLVSTNGTGSTMQITDPSSPGDDRRFYRVRVGD